MIFFRYNIEGKVQTQSLTAHFHGLKTTHPLLLAIDQEGGKVQRLNAANGFTDYKSAKDVAEMLTPEQALTHYKDMAVETSTAGFNVVFGPVVDLDHHPEAGPDAPVNPVIGGLKRAYSAIPTIVAEYAEQFITAHHDQKILTSLKHFPGHGLAPTDSHIDLTDVTTTYDADIELAPYKILGKKGLMDMVMTAHVMMRNLDDKHPATLSPVIIKELLRGEKGEGFDGVVISDDLFMGAIQKHYNLEEIVLRAIEADVDILLFSTNTAAQKGINQEDKKPADANLVDKIIGIVEAALQSGRLTEERIQKSYDRVIAMKTALH